MERGGDVNVGTFGGTDVWQCGFDGVIRPKRIDFDDGLERVYRKTRNRS